MFQTKRSLPRQEFKNSNLTNDSSECVFNLLFSVTAFLFNISGKQVRQKFYARSFFLTCTLQLARSRSKCEEIKTLHKTEY